MKKILVIHNKYRIFGGEDSNIADELRLLEKLYEVDYIEFDNSSRFSILDFFYLIIGKNLTANTLLKQKIKNFQPDFAYVHNIWFRGNVGLFKVLEKNKIKTFLKIHNFRYECTRHFLSKNHLKGLKECPMCGFSNKTIFNKYFDESFSKSFLAIIFGKRYFKILKKNEVEIIVLNNFHFDKILNSEVPQEKIKIAKNPVAIFHNQSDYNPDSNYIFYAGTLSKAKGLEELVDTWSKLNNPKFKLKIAGDGELKNFIISKQNTNLEYAGVLNNKESQNLIKNSRAVITFTKMYEGQPRLLGEASSFGVPSIFPDYGGISDYFPIDYRLSFKQFDYVDALSKLDLLNNPKFLLETSKQIFSFVVDEFDENNILKLYKEIFIEY